MALSIASASALFLLGGEWRRHQFDDPPDDLYLFVDRQSTHLLKNLLRACHGESATLRPGRLPLGGVRDIGTVRHHLGVTDASANDGSDLAYYTRR
jgi:hypothetical protein